MTDVQSVETAAKAGLSKFEQQLAFVKANWVSVSLVVIAAAVVGFVVRSFL